MIVGAGPAGLGIALMLRELKVRETVVLERSEPGASFRKWPKEMRFITPSFPGNFFGNIDLNSIAIYSSPAHVLRTEHPSGIQYADYLKDGARRAELPIRCGVDVFSVTPEDGGFQLETSNGVIRSKIVIWAAGEFQYPRLDPFPGAEHCLHNSLVGSWAERPGEEACVIGGYESGLDAAIALVANGKKVTVLDQHVSWQPDQEYDPSRIPSPYTLQRLRGAMATGRLQLCGNSPVVGVRKENDCYLCDIAGGPPVMTRQQPILAAGFAGSLSLIRPLFEFEESGNVCLTPHDESTRVPGLFLVGPAVRQKKVVFCFIYKFRQRFAVVAAAVAKRLSVDCGRLDEYRKHNFYLDDLACCEQSCTC